MFSTAACCTKANTTLSGGAPFVGALDGFTSGALEFWSHRRKLVSSYAGPILQGRRTSDNTPIDVSALANGEIDESGLLSFAGSSSVALPAVYGQLSGRDLLQGTADEQRIIVDSGSLVNVGGKAASRGLRAPSFTPDHGGTLLTNIFPNYTGPVSIFLRGEYGSYTGIFAAIVDSYVSFGSNDNFGDDSSRTAICHRPGTDAVALPYVGDTSGGFVSNYLLSIIFDGSTITIKDGTSTFRISQPSALNFNRFAIGYMLGISDFASDANRIQEVAVWTTDQTSNEAAIRSALTA